MTKPGYKIEYWIHYGDPDDNNDPEHIEGRYWQRVRNLMVYPPPNLHSIERIRNTFDIHGSLSGYERETVYINGRIQVRLPERDAKSGHRLYYGWSTIGPSGDIQFGPIDE